MVLASRGVENPQQARALLRCDGPLDDPFLMTDMALAAGRVAVAIENREKIAVFGDYDVDGITATCLLYEFLRSCGADCVTYIPGRMEEGYGLNPTAIRQLAAQGVKLIVTVDCGITAVAEAELCKEMGIDLVITDHHECKECLPDAVAVVDPHRPDCTYPHKTLSGVGVAFKLAAALCGSQEQVLDSYADMVCLGTVADVMLMQGENRVFVARGLEMMRTCPRLGIAALMAECGCAPETVNAMSIGFMLAPRINAAGRMEKIELATELFLTDDEDRAAELAKALCDLNRQRQTVESEIYEQVTASLALEAPPAAIVLKGETWHQGVVGIVASRIAEEYHCPTFLICMDGDHGKASSRSYGGFNLFAALTELSPLLESYGGHELAAGFTIHRDRIDDFRREITRYAKEFFAQTDTRTELDVDCAVMPEVLTVAGIDSLKTLEPCGNGCPKPMLMMEKLQVERITMVGGGRHMRLRLRCGHYGFNAIYFSATPQTASVEPGDLVDVAFQPHVNEFRGERSVQMNVQDIRPHCQVPCDPDTAAYRALCRDTISTEQAAALLPDRATLGMVWRYLTAAPQPIQESPVCLCRKIVRWSGQRLDTARLLTCLDIFADVNLLYLDRHHNFISVRLSSPEGKADLNQSQTMQRLLLAKES
jgi:single-stranded-DNA-specific exonuclease